MDFEDPAKFRDEGHFAHRDILGGPDPYYYHPVSPGTYQEDSPWAYLESGNLYIQMGWRAIPRDYGDNIDNHYGINQ